MKLTRLSIALLALIVLAGIAQQWGWAEALPWWRLFALLFFAGLIYEWMNNRNAKLELNCPEDYQLRLGYAEDVRFSLVNKGRRTRHIEFAPDLPENIDTSEGIRSLLIAPGAQAELSMQLLARSLGQYHWLRFPLRMQGVLKLALWPYKLTPGTQFSVIPHLREVHSVSEGAVSSGDPVAMPGSGLELHHLRDYRPGDSLKAISWKATARSQKTVTRVFSDEQHPNIVLVLDAGRTSLTHVQGMSQLAHYINLASTFAYEAISSGDYVGLVIASDKPAVALPPQRGRQAALRIHRTLKNLRADAVEVDTLATAVKVEQVARNRCLVVYFTDLYNQSVDGNLGQSIALWGRRHLPLLVGIVDDNIVAMSENTSHNEREALDSLAATEYRRTLATNAEGARRMGAQVILTSPAGLNAEVMGEYRKLKALRRI